MNQLVDNFFLKAQQQHSLSDIARVFGLHVGTIKRWAQTGHVPKSYTADFARLVGEEYEIETATIRDKDQFYTKPQTARNCFTILQKVAQNLKIDLDEYCFIEPAAGSGFFYDIFPEERRIGIDIDPTRDGIITSDFLEWSPPFKGGYYIVCGNPPFGLRGHLALQFINHAYGFADMVAFILPPLFDSDGKGVPAKRVQGYELAHSEKLPADSFCYPDGSDIAINTIFQVWTKIKTDRIKRVPRKTCKSFVRVYSLSDGGTPSSTRNKDMIGNCDVYIPSTCFRGMKAYRSFDELPNKRGYGVVVNKNKTDIKKLLFSHDWMKTAFASTNSAINMRTSLIEKVVIEGGYYDKD